MIQSHMESVEGVGEVLRRKKLPGRARQALTDGHLFEQGIEG